MKVNHAFRLRYVLTVCIVAAGLTYAIREASARITGTVGEGSASELHSTARLTYPDKSELGLPAHARVNATMFAGLRLSARQGDSIATLAEGFAERRRELFVRVAPAVVNGGEFDSLSRQLVMPLIDEQRLAYRAVLKPEQRVIYDRTTSRMLASWRELRRPVSGTTK